MGLKKLLQKKWLHIILIICPIFFIYKQITGHLWIDYIKMTYGWTYVWSQSIWTYLFYIYYFTFVTWSIYLTIDFSKKNKDYMKKNKQN